MIGLFPSVKIYPDNPNPFNNSAYNSGPALAMAIIVSYPKASISYSNLLDSIAANSFAFLISNSAFSFSYLIVYSYSFYLYLSAASFSILDALVLNYASSYSFYALIYSALATASASAIADPYYVTSYDLFSISNNFYLASSAFKSSSILN